MENKKIMTNWEKLCKYIKPLIGTSVRENALHQSFEVWLQDIFHWDEASVKHEVPVRVGHETKRADIVLHGNDFGIVIEMKAPDINLDDNEVKGQLISYMRYLNCKYGFLVGNKLTMFYDDGEAVTPVKKVADIGFAPSNKDGVEFGEILDKSVCSDEKLEAYAKKEREPEKPITDGEGGNSSNGGKGRSMTNRNPGLQDLENIKTELERQANGAYKIRGPGNNGTIILSSVKKRTFFYITYNANGYRFSWQTTDTTRFADFREIAQSIQQSAKSSDAANFEIGDGKNPMGRLWITIKNQTYPLQEILQVITDTRNKVRYPG